MSIAWNEINSFIDLSDLFIVVWKIPNFLQNLQHES